VATKARFGAIEKVVLKSMTGDTSIVPCRDGRSRLELVSERGRMVAGYAAIVLLTVIVEESLQLE
jgi:hypothetical protein